MDTGALFWGTLFASVCVYWLLPRGRDWFLISVSFTYLAALAPWSVLALVGWFFAFYLLAPKTQGRPGGAKFRLAALVIPLLCYLAFFKYVPPIASYIGQYFGPGDYQMSVALPLGISYFTFKLLHYAIEVSRNNIKQHPPQLFLLYLLMFTIFPAGPIERFNRFVENRETSWNVSMLVDGWSRIIYGVIKKFLIAEHLVLPLLQWPSPSTGHLLSYLDSYSAGAVWFHAAAWFAYFYLDFSAYSDLAIGASRLFGFRICENFNFPFLATSIGNFWQRWHMSLAQWCRSYVYMPLIGVTRNASLAAFVTMITIALWHQGNLNWLCWGIYHAIGLIVYQRWLYVKRKRGLLNLKTPVEKRMMALVGWQMTLFFVIGSYVFLATNKFGAYAGLRLFAKLFGVDVPA